MLYTFDDENKSNCLARLPSVVNIPTVQIDEGTQIGVIELKTCIQAIVSARYFLFPALSSKYSPVGEFILVLTSLKSRTRRETWA